MKAGRIVAVATLVAAALVAAPTSVSAGPGDLDSSIGDCGLRIAWLNGVGSLSAPELQQLPVLQQADGKALQLAARGPSIFVARLRSSGERDRTWAVGRHNIAKIGISRQWRFSGAALGPDGKLVIAVVSGDETRVFRLTNVGTLDPTFGGDGRVVLDAPMSADVVVQSDNKPLVMTGTGSEPPFSSVVRLEESGAIDPSYTFTNPVGAPEIPMHGGTMAIDAADRVLLGGNGDNLSSFQYRIGRWDANGDRDTTFLIEEPAAAEGDPGGLVKVAVLRNGRILVGGGVFFENPRRNDLLLRRYLADGSPDVSFAGDGSLTHSIGRWDALVSMREAGDRDVVVLGDTVDGVNGFDVSLLRVRPDGTPDDGFGRSGHTAARLLSAYPPNGFALYGDTILVVTTRGIAAPSGFFGRTVLARFRTDVTEPGTGLVLDESGRLSPIGPPGSPAPCVFDGPRWTTNVLQDCYNCVPRIVPFDGGPNGFRARGAALVPGYGGYVVDRTGAVMTFSLGVRPRPAPAQGGPTWPGQDVARGVAARSSGRGGYVLDAFGGLHGFTTGTNPMPARTRGGPSWPGWDIARGVALFPSGAGGYVLDGFGGLHGFAVGSNPMPPAVHGNFMTPGRDIARGVAILPGGAGGYVVDAVGNLHPFGIGSNPVPPPLAGADLTGFPGARGLVLLSPVPAPAVVPGGPASAPPQPLLRWKKNTWRLSLDGVP